MQCKIDDIESHIFIYVTNMYQQNYVFIFNTYVFNNYSNYMLKALFIEQFIGIFPLLGTITIYN